jgi:hypothetical protein
VRGHIWRTLARFSSAHFCNVRVNPDKHLGNCMSLGLIFAQTFRTAHLTFSLVAQA